MDIDSYKVRGRGPSAPEKHLGADGIGIVLINTPNTRLFGFFLFQAKKASSTASALHNARSQCTSMLDHTAASCLIVLLRRNVAVCSAMAVAASDRSGPTLGRLPYAAFSSFFVDQILRGLMLSPLDPGAIAVLTDLVRDEGLRYIVTMIGGRGFGGEDLTNILGSLDVELDRLSLDL